MDEYFDLTSGEVETSFDDHTVVDRHGHIYGRVGDHWAKDYSTGEMHFLNHIGSGNDHDDDDF